MASTNTIKNLIASQYEYLLIASNTRHGVTRHGVIPETMLTVNA